jgi:hypothetical protein
MSFSNQKRESHGLGTQSTTKIDIFSFITEVALPISSREGG